MPEREFYMLISIMSDKNNLLKNESIDWAAGRFKQIYWGMYPCDKVGEKRKEIIQSANEHGYKILNTRIIKAKTTP
jgi:hypothetical protein